MFVFKFFKFFFSELPQSMFEIDAILPKKECAKIVIIIKSTNYF